jgi:hypothetical protein
VFLPDCQNHGLKCCDDYVVVALNVLGPAVTGRAGNDADREAVFRPFDAAYLATIGGILRPEAPERLHQ